MSDFIRVAIQAGDVTDAPRPTATKKNVKVETLAGPVEKCGACGEALNRNGSCAACKKKEYARNWYAKKAAKAKKA